MTRRSAGVCRQRCCLTALLLLLAMPPAHAATPEPDLIGSPTTVVTDRDDTLLDIARAFDVGYVEIRIANPGIDPWLPGAGAVVTVPTQHVLPDAPRRGIVINLAELRLYYFPADGTAPLSYPIGIGDEGKQTPVTQTSVMRKAQHPRWVPTRSEHEENPALPDMVPPGPNNPMGDYALYLALKGYAIHGTNAPYGVGRRVSHGCIRLYPEDIRELYARVRVGTPVTIVDQPAKAGWYDGTLYLEVHPRQADANAIEVHGRPLSPPDTAADAVVRKAAGRAVDRVDWDSVLTAEIERSGMPVAVTSASAAAAGAQPVQAQAARGQAGIDPRQ